MEKVRRTAAIYYLIQGFAVLAWWAMLAAVPESRGWFRLEADSHTSLLAFWLPDLVLIAIGSLAASYFIYSKSMFETAAMWLVTGSVSYASFYTFSFASITDYGWLGVALMLPAMLWSGVFATVLTFDRAMFRQAKAASVNTYLFKTLAQIVIVWGLILFVFPYLITVLEDKIGISRFQFPLQRPLAVLLFVTISSLGVWAAIVMSRVGKGTPLPLDHASELVVVGPYRYVRNPMALSGIGQGLAVALFLGSPLVAAYALMGSAIWQYVFRPPEEDDMAERFGEPYEEYRRAVRCWVPRASEFRAKENTNEG